MKQTMHKAPLIHRKIAKAISTVFGSEPSIYKYSDDPGDRHIDILCCENSPWEGVSSFSTIGLSDELGWETTDGVPFGVEFIGACRTEVEQFPNLLASAAFKTLKNGIQCRPHTVIEGVFAD